MPFQSAVNFDLAYGVPGEFAFDGPRRAEPGILAAAAVVGRVCTEDPAVPGSWTPGLVASSIRQSVLTSPKQYALTGTAGNTLSPSLELPANASGEFATMGQIWVISSTANKPGDVVYFNNTTGAISTTAPGATAPASSTLLRGAVVAPRAGSVTSPANGLTVITITGPVAAA